MITKILIAVYVAVVMLFSLYSNANTISNVPVTFVSFNQESLELKIQGYFANSCQGEAKPVLVKKADHTFEVQVLSTKVHTGQYCLQVISGTYELAFDVRSLGLPAGKNALSISLVGQVNPTATFEVVVPETVFAFDFSSSELIGRFQLASADGEMVLVTETMIYEVKSGSLDLLQFAGKQVSVFGHDVTPTIDPVNVESENVVDTKLTTVFRGGNGVFFVTGVSSK